MSQYEERERQAAAQDAARAHQWEAYERAADARTTAARGWKWSAFVLVDSILAAGIVGLNAAILGIACTYAVFAAQLSVLDSLVFGGLPLLALGLLLICITIGPLPLRRMSHPKLALNVALVAWSVGSLIFWIGGVVAISKRG